MSSFNCHFRVANDPQIKAYKRVGALRCCIRYLLAFDEQGSYTKLIQRFEDTFEVSLRSYKSKLSDEMIRLVLMEVVRERNIKLEMLRRQEKHNLRRKLQRRFKINKAGV